MDLSVSAEFTRIIFWIIFAVIFYTFLGYGIILYILVKLFRKEARKKIDINEDDLPTVSVIIAAYNEEDFIKEKLKNLRNLEYPINKMQLIFITDGSNDRTYDILSKEKDIKLYHQSERKGKTAAINRIMPLIKNKISIFNDANTLINKEAVINIVRHFINDPQVGAVAGEKRIQTSEYDTASSAGEGFYWRYESFLKKYDAQLNSVVGAAGELFAIRTELYNYPAENIIIEDFVVTLRIAMDGKTVKYEPEAFASETSSISVKEELKRKIRIAAGGIQAIILLRSLLNVFQHGWLSFQFISHRVLRWTITPVLLPVLFVLNLIIIVQSDSILYLLLFAGQVFFYLAGLIGYILQSMKIKFKIFFIPYYFIMMNYAVCKGFFRFLKGSQSAVWERAKRAA